MKRLSILLSALAFLLISCEPDESTEINRDFSAYYDEYNVEGSFILFDQERNRTVLSNKNQFEKPFTPASTFKILNSLIGLETGVIVDENYVIPWDGVTRNPVWDQDHDLQMAYKNSAVWYYQELARRVGNDEMQQWVDEADYGNENISGGIDMFWLEGGLRITPKQQIEFLKKIHDNSLPFSDRSMQILKKIMVETDTTDYILRSKTGWGDQANQDIGWYVGYVETGDNVYYFANCIQIESSKNEELEQAIKFDKARKEIAKRILQELEIL